MPKPETGEDRRKAGSGVGDELHPHGESRPFWLVLRPDRGLYPFQNNLFRANDAQLSAGSEVILPGMRAKVIAVGAEGPFDVSFEFDRDLDAATFVWLVENFDGFRAADLPKPGFGLPFDP